MRENHYAFSHVLFLKISQVSKFEISITLRLFTNNVPLQGRYSYNCAYKYSEVHTQNKMFVMLFQYN